MAAESVEQIPMRAGVEEAALVRLAVQLPEARRRVLLRAAGLRVDRYEGAAAAVGETVRRTISSPIPNRVRCPARKCARDDSERARRPRYGGLLRPAAMRSGPGRVRRQRGPGIKQNGLSRSGFAVSTFKAGRKCELRLLIQAMSRTTARPARGWSEDGAEGMLIPDSLIFGRRDILLGSTGRSVAIPSRAG